MSVADQEPADAVPVPEKRRQRRAFREDRLDEHRLRALRVWCRRRADTKLARCRDMLPFWLDRQPHEEVRYRLGLTVEEYRRARRWLDRAKEYCLDSGEHLGVEEALRLIADEHVEKVLRLGLLRQRGCTREQIMSHLNLSRDGYDQLAEWWRDAVLATTERRG